MMRDHEREEGALVRPSRLIAIEAAFARVEQAIPPTEWT